MDGFDWLLTGSIVFGISFFLYYYVYMNKIKKSAGLLCRIFLFEKVGNSKVYIGERIGEFKKSAGSLGSYIDIRGENAVIRRLSNNDMVQDKEYKKSLFVMKYAEDDYRPFGFLSDDWFKVENVEDFKKDSKGKLIPVLDDDGNPLSDENGQTVFETVIVEKEVRYDEPMGITQDGRDALRFVLEYKKEMDDRFSQKKGWWDRYGQYIVPLTAIIAVVFLTMFMVNKDTERQKMFYDEVNLETTKAANIISNPNTAEAVYDWFSKRNDNTEDGGAPPN